MATDTNLVLRNDTILGVCEAIGRDFGFHPNWLRLTLAGLFYWFPLGVTAGYLALGVAVFVSRWLAPDSSEAPAANHAAEQPANVEDEEDMAIAA